MKSTDESYHIQPQHYQRRAPDDGYHAPEAPDAVPDGLDNAPDKAQDAVDDGILPPLAALDASGEAQQQREDEAEGDAQDEHAEEDVLHDGGVSARHNVDHSFTDDENQEKVCQGDGCGVDIERYAVNEVQPGLGLAPSVSSGAEQEDRAGQHQQQKYHADVDARAAEVGCVPHYAGDSHRARLGIVEAVDHILLDIFGVAEAFDICNVAGGADKHADKRHIQQHDGAGLGPKTVRELHALFRRFFGINRYHFVVHHFLPSIL